MTLWEVISKLKENQFLISAGIIIVLTLVQIAPIKINPWTRILKIIRHIFTGDISEQVKQLSKEVNCLRQESEEREAVNARIRILRFSDDLIHGANYSQEHFKTLFDEITRYNNYCDEHPKFRNELTIQSCKIISSYYQNAVASGKFRSEYHFDDNPDYLE